MPRVTLQQIAARINVSTMTVSLALRDSPRISEVQRNRIQQLAQQMGYKPDVTAVALALRRNEAVPHPISACLAWINQWPQPEGLRKFAEFDLYWKGATEMAEKLGFRIEEFVIQGSMSYARLHQVLQARHIEGILVPPHRGSEMPNANSLDWSQYATVRIGYSVPHLPLPVVAGNHMQAILLAYQKIEEKGYIRIGYVCPTIRYTYNKAGVLLRESQIDPSHRIPILELPSEHCSENLQRLNEWLDDHRPDAILTEIRELRMMLAELGREVPGEIGLATVSVLDGNADAGLLQNSSEIGREAVRFLRSMIYHRQYGIPTFRHEILIDSFWQDGSTLPDRVT